jgi:hypothetical protein
MNKARWRYPKIPPGPAVIGRKLAETLTVFSVETVYRISIYIVPQKGVVVK